MRSLLIDHSRRFVQQYDEINAGNVNTFAFLVRFKKFCEIDARSRSRRIAVVKLSWEFDRER